MPHRSMGEMVRDQHPLTMGPDATVQEACAAMHRRRVGAVLVTDPVGRLLGIFTGRDAVHFLSHGRDSAEIRLAEAMTRHPICLPPEGNAMDALHMMADGGFRHLRRLRFAESRFVLKGFWGRYYVR